MEILAKALEGEDFRILAVNFGDAYKELLQALPEATGERLVREREMIGTSHAEIGAYLMGLWGVESSILIAIGFHHNPLDSQETVFGPLTAVHAANGLNYHLRHPQGNGHLLHDHLDAPYFEALGITGRIETWKTACADLGEESL